METIDRRPVVRVVPAHGTRARYVHRSLSCHCSSCTAANTAYMAAYRARPREPWAPRTWRQLTLEVGR